MDRESRRLQGPLRIPFPECDAVAARSDRCPGALGVVRATSLCIGEQRIASSDRWRRGLDVVDRQNRSIILVRFEWLLVKFENSA